MRWGEGVKWRKQTLMLASRGSQGPDLEPHHLWQVRSLFVKFIGLGYDLVPEDVELLCSRNPKVCVCVGGGT